MLSANRRTIPCCLLGLILAAWATACSGKDASGSSVPPVDATEIAVALAAQGFPDISTDVSHDHVSDDGEIETVRTLVVPDRLDIERISDELGHTFLVVDKSPSNGPYWLVEKLSQISSSDGSSIYEVTLSANNEEVYFAGSQFFGVEHGMVVPVEPPPGVFPTTVVS